MVRNYAPTFHAFSTALLVGSLAVDVWVHGYFKAFHGHNIIVPCRNNQA